MNFRNLLVDTSPLRDSRPFRRMWLSGLVTSVGTQMSVFVVAFQIFTITHNSFAVGAVGLFVAIPSITLGLFGGAIADAFDRRTLVVLSTAGQALTSVALTAQAFARLNEVWVLYLLVAVQAVFSVVGVPARRALVTRLVSKRQLPAAIALSLFTMHLSVITGPLLAGTMTTWHGIRFTYLLYTLSFATAAVGLAGLPAAPIEKRSTATGLAAVGEGLSHMRRRPILLGALLTDLSITVLGFPVALFPRSTRCDSVAAPTRSACSALPWPWAVWSAPCCPVPWRGPRGRAGWRSRRVSSGARRWWHSVPCITFGSRSPYW